MQRKSEKLDYNIFVVLLERIKTKSNNFFPVCIKSFIQTAIRKKYQKEIKVFVTYS